MHRLICIFPFYKYFALHNKLVLQIIIQTTDGNLEKVKKKKQNVRIIYAQFSKTMHEKMK